MVKYKKKVLSIIMSIIIGSALFSCTYEKGELPTKGCVSPNVVSFSQDIIPIFNTYCNIAGCHTSTDLAGNLNLQASVAYSQLMKPGKGYIDTLQPNYSLLYAQMNSSSNPMPKTGKLDDCTIGLVLKWIQQKAKNN
jgi:hypothetical protein